MHFCLWTAWLCLAACVSAHAAASNESQGNPHTVGDAGPEYYLYVPAKLMRMRHYQVLVVMHDAGQTGEGAMGWAKLAREASCVVIAPTFHDDYRDPASGSGKSLHAILRDAGKKVPIHKHIIITGFGDGAEFALRFALANPTHVAGCAAHSPTHCCAPDPRASRVLFMVTCGGKDTERLAETRRFADRLRAARFRMRFNVVEGAGYTYTEKAHKLTRDLFWVASTGLTTEQRDQIEASVQQARTHMGEGRYGDAVVLLKRVVALLRLSPEAQCSEDLLQQIETLGTKRIESLDALARSDADKAIAMAERTVKQFQGTRFEQEAQRRLDALQDPMAREMREKQRATKRRAWLSMARNFITNGKPKMARPYLKKLIDTFPDSPEAAQAKKMLEKL